MNTITRITFALGLALGLTSFCAEAQETGFFRLVSTQQTYIVSLDTSGLLVWSNAVAGASGQVQVKRKVDGVWTNNFPMGPVRTNGSLAQVRVPMCHVLERWIVAFQPSATLVQAEALFDANGIIWQPLAWNSLRMATIHVPQGRSLSAIINSSDVRYVEWDTILEAY